MLEMATASQGDPAATPRAMLVFAHPDDETIALGAHLGRFGAAHFIHVTDGAPRNEQDSRAHGFATLQKYRDARRDELRHAMTLAGLEPHSVPRATKESKLLLQHLAEFARQRRT